MIGGNQVSRGGPLTFAMTLMIASLGVLFAASLIGYWLTRARIDGIEVTVPDLLWYSTILLIAAGVLLSLASWRLHGGAAPLARTLLVVSAVVTAGFLAVQIPALVLLLQEHPSASAAGNPMLGFVFFLVLLHALHVLGGLIALAVILWRVRGRALSADQDGSAVRQTTRYWHFLDLVWVVMFAVFLLG
ncbi:hypothetical protein GF314_10710 [bacterium]|nr:hypothetical protein [bacterium]